MEEEITMKVSIIGYGVMGKLIEQSCKERNIAIASIIDPIAPQATHKEISATALKDADVCIEFTTPQVVIANIQKIAALKKNIVIGTTGWFEEMNQVKAMVLKNNIGCIWSGNYSIGVNLYFRILRETSKMMNHVPEYDVYGYEIHHARKKDSPSGTAEMINTILLEELDAKKKKVTQRLDRQRSPDEIHFASIRGGDVPGTHTVVFDSAFDAIELKHTAKTRDGFAKGAVLAAEFIHQKKGLFSIDDMMDQVIQVPHAQKN